jgi:predicted RNA binding protein YcfA (HicA-like mRNA interferase family)
MPIFGRVMALATIPTVTAVWDEEAAVFYSQSDIPGLVIEAGTLDEFRALVRELSPVVMRENGMRAAKAVFLNVDGAGREMLKVWMPKTYDPELVAILKQAGWRLEQGGKGSHEKWRSQDGMRIVIVPRSKSRHTAHEVLKQAGLPKAFWPKNSSGRLAADLRRPETPATNRPSPRIPRRCGGPEHPWAARLRFVCAVVGRILEASGRQKQRKPAALARSSIVNLTA